LQLHGGHKKHAKIKGPTQNKRKLTRTHAHTCRRAADAGRGSAAAATAAEQRRQQQATKAKGKQLDKRY